MLSSILDTLQQNSLFQHCLREQLRLLTPDPNRMCDCCLSCVGTSSHLPSLIDQLVDRKLQVCVDLNSIRVAESTRSREIPASQGVCADQAEALRFKQEGTKSFRQAAYRQAAESYTGMLFTSDQCTLYALRYLDRFAVPCRGLDIP